MTTTYTDWITNYPEGTAQDDLEADESRDEDVPLLLPHWLLRKERGNGR